MPAPATASEFLTLVRKSEVVDEKRLKTCLEKHRALPSEPSKMAGLLVHEGLITRFQAENLLQGKYKRFSIGKYKVLDRIGSGGMAQVFLCEHKLMRRRVALKVLPTAKSSDESALKRFYREARAAAALDHPNIVRAHDIDQDHNVHFLVMEYVDGSSLQDIVSKTGPMEVNRAAHYIRQAALGLEHAHTAGIVHRDIKPGNILVDRSGTVKILDMGLARFFNDETDLLSQKFNEDVLGTADYLAPEQTVDSHSVDIRADIYSLGATFYYLLTGQTLFGEGTIAQKLLAHQQGQPRPISSLRDDVPSELHAVIDKMLAKDRAARYQTPAEVAEALKAWTQAPIAAPSSAEMPGELPADSGAPSSGNLRAPGPTSSSGILSTAQNPPSSEWEAVASEPAEAPIVPITRRPRAPAPGQNRNWRVIAVIASVAVVGLVVAIVAMSGKGPQDGSKTGRKALEVSRDPARDAYRTIKDALRNARSGETVTILDDTIQEHLVVDSTLPSANIKLQAAPGKSVVWKGKSDEALIVVSGARNFVLNGKGITLDGGGKVRDLVRLQLACPGVVIQDLNLVNFTRSAVHFANCTGDAKNPVRVTGLLSGESEDVKPQAGLLFEANPQVNPPKNDHIVIGPCEFRGFASLEAAIMKKAEAVGLNVTIPMTAK